MQAGAHVERRRRARCRTALVTTVAAMLISGVAMTTAAAADEPASAPATLANETATISTFGHGLLGLGDMAAGPDGNMWFTTFRGYARITPSGAITEFPYVVQPTSLAAGPDGTVWFTSIAGVGRITTAGAAQTFPGALPGRTLVLGPDGNMWTSTGTSINRITPSGTLTRFTDPSMTSVGRITFGADGNVWFTQTNTRSIGRMTMSGTVTVFADDRLENEGDIAAGPDGNLWATAWSPGQDETGGGGGYPAKNWIVRITPAGAMTFFAGGSEPRLIVAGPDGDLWFANGGPTWSQYVQPVGSVQHVSTAGAFSAAVGEPGRPRPGDSFHPTTSTAPIDGIAFGADGNLWFTGIGSNSVNRVTPALALTSFHGTDVNGPHDIVFGADGNLWFANSGMGMYDNYDFTYATADRDAGSVGRSTPGGAVSSFRSSLVGRPERMTLGPDGNIWFNDTETATLDRVDPQGNITTFSTSHGVSSLTSGADGNLWITEGSGNGIERVDSAGGATRFVLPTSRTPKGITNAPDGNLWFATGEASIGRITPAGVITIFPSPVGFQYPDRIVAGADGNLWFTSNYNGNYGHDTIGRMTPTGTYTFFTDSSLVDARSMTRGADGNVWITNGATNQKVPHIGRITPGGTFSWYSSPDVRQANSIVAGPDGAMWFTTTGPSALGRLTVHAAGTPSPAAFPAATSRPDGAKLTWWLPAASEGVTGGFVTPTCDGVTLAPTPFTGRAPEPIVTGLVAGRTCTFTVSLTNAVGTGPPSARTAPIVIGAPTAPAFPKATATTGGGVSVSWWAQPVTGGVITPYLGGVAQAPIPFTGNTNHRLITGLTIAQSYRFTITLTNSYGTGPPSALTNAVTVTA